jgi:hypothetical protein
MTVPLACLVPSPSSQRSLEQRRVSIQLGQPCSTVAWGPKQHHVHSGCSQRLGTSVHQKGGWHDLSNTLAAGAGGSTAGAMLRAADAAPGPMKAAIPKLNLKVRRQTSGTARTAWVTSKQQSSATNRSHPGISPPLLHAAPPCILHAALYTLTSSPTHPGTHAFITAPRPSSTGTPSACAAS